MPLPKSVLCSACRKTYPEGWKRCPYCGHDELRQKQENQARRFMDKKIREFEQRTGKTRPQREERGGKPQRPQQQRPQPKPQQQSQQQRAQPPAAAEGGDQARRRRRRRGRGGRGPAEPRNAAVPAAVQAPSRRPEPRRPEATGAPAGADAGAAKKRRRFRRRRRPGGGEPKGE